MNDTNLFSAYAKNALNHLESTLSANLQVMEKLSKEIAALVNEGKNLLVFGSGHSALFPLELYHRAGGASFIQPVVGEYLLPTAGPPVIRVTERTPGAALPLLYRVMPVKGEMIWISSQSGINSASIDIALESKKLGLKTVAFTSVLHSSKVTSRHSSGKRLFEVCDDVVDFGGYVGDASIEVAPDLKAGPLSTLTSVFLGHNIVTAACALLEKQGTRCVYTSVNTPEGEKRNKDLEKIAMKRDWLLRQSID